MTSKIASQCTYREHVAAAARPTIDVIGIMSVILAVELSCMMAEMAVPDNYHLHTKTLHSARAE
jgi:hypothetical protein